MKIRNGFVSNSSSSSFVVAFPKVPESAEEVQNILFGDDEKFKMTYENDFIPTIEMARVVFNDIKDQTPNDEDSIFNGFGGWLEGGPEYPNYDSNISDKERNKLWKKYDMELDKYQRKICNKFIKDNENSFIYVFEYSDNDGAFYTTMEHGDIFSRLPNKRISRH